MPNPRWTELYGLALDSGQPLRVDESSESISVRYPPAKRLNARVPAFIDWLVEHLEHQSP